MPDQVFVDTSFVLALINERDQYHEQAQRLSFKFDQSPLVTTVGVLLEIGNALANGFKKEASEVIALLRSSNRIDVIELDQSLFDKAMRLYQKYEDKKWGLVDCISFVVMEERGITDVLSFDTDFTTAGFNRLTS